MGLGLMEWMKTDLPRDRMAWSSSEGNGWRGEGGGGLGKEPGKRGATAFITSTARANVKSEM